MRYTTFNQIKNNQLLEPMFFGNPVNVARYDQQRHRIFEKLTEKQVSFFWRPEEIDVSKDKRDFASLSSNEQHIFVSNLQYQILLDSVQGRSPNVAFLPIVSLPEAETFIETWSFFETIHSRSYTHIVRAIFNNPSSIFDEIVENQAILSRAQDISVYYDDLIQATQTFQYLGEGSHVVVDTTIKLSKRSLKQKLYLCMCSVNALEAIRFYVSFACTFAFNENKLMTGSAKIMRLISRDEAVHLTFTQHVLNLWKYGKDDPEMAEIAEELKQQAIDIFISAVNQEKQWANYLFKDGSMMGLNAVILSQYIEFIANQRMAALGFDKPFDQRENPIPWINNYLSSDAEQVAPQEQEITSYLVSQVNAEIHMEDFAETEL